MGNHIHSVINPVPTLEEEKGDDGEPHTFSNESSSYKLKEEEGGDG